MPIDTGRFFPAAAPTRPAADRSARLLIAAGVSTYGDWLTVVALAVLLFRLTHQAEAPAAYILVRVAPRVLGPAPGGSLADRFGPGRVAGWCALAQGVLTGAVVVFAGSGALWAIFAAVAGAQFLGSMAQPAYSACIPRVTPSHRLLRVNAIYSGLFESSVLAAPAVGALLLSLVQPQALVAADAGSFGVAGILMLSLQVGPARSTSFRDRGPVRASTLVRRDPMLRSLAASFFCTGVAITALQAVLVVAAAERFGQDTSVGWLYAAVGAGGVAGSLLLLRWRPAQIGARGVSLGFLVEIVPLALFALIGNLPAALALLALSTAAGALYQTRGQTALQQRVAAGMLGRVNGLMRLLLYSGMLVGAGAAVALVQVLGWSTLVLTTAAAATGAYLAAVLALRTRARRPDEITLAGTPMLRAADQTATASRTSFSMGSPTELPHSLHEPS